MSKIRLHPNQSSKRGTSISDKVKARLVGVGTEKILRLDMLARVKREVEKNVAAIAIPEKLMDDGHDPVFALYGSVQQMMSFCAELFLGMPELRAFGKRLEKADNDYQPGYPPMSPITGSYFAMWTLCDLRVGEGPETIASIFAETGALFGLGTEVLASARILADSRMGIYQHCGLKNGSIILRELVTDKEISFVGTSGYVGQQGELWLVRAVPPPADDIPYWIGMGTPHVLRRPKQSEWLALFARNDIRSGEVGVERRLDQFLKFGPKPRFWSEFIFEGYAGYNSGAIFLQGLPDVPESRPHSPRFNPRYTP